MLIDADKLLSKSLLWDIQNAYFHSAGIRAWQDDVVPHQISCSPFMARSYANLIVAYLQDIKNDIDPTQPVTIVELGAGSGRLTYHLIHQLHLLLGDIDQFKFILSDYTSSLFDFWQQHPQLRPLADAGRLDFALFDATNPTLLKLTHSGQSLNHARHKNPIILIANYFFDSIPQDSFVIEDGQLHTNYLSLHSTQNESDLTDPTLWERLTFDYEPLPVATPYAENGIYNQILRDYEQLPDTSLTFPNIGLDCLQFWMYTPNLLLLTADRGHSHAADLIGQPDPLPNLHGSFSMMVNYHAITEFVERCDGRAFVPPHYQNHIQTVAYALSHAPHTYPVTQQTFTQTICQNGPNDYFALQDHLLTQIKEMRLDQFLSLMRWSADDPAILQAGLPHLPAWIAAEPAWVDDVIDMLERVKEQYLVIDPTDPFINTVNQLLTTFQP